VGTDENLRSSKQIHLELCDSLLSIYLILKYLGTLWQHLIARREYDRHICSCFVRILTHQWPIARQLVVKQRCLGDLGGISYGMNFGGIEVTIS